MNFYYFLLFTMCIARIPLPDSTDNSFQSDCLSLTNKYRTIHHAQPLQIDQSAVNYAKSRCQLISQSNALSHGHAGLQGYGENLYWGGSSSPNLGSCSDAINAWYNEVNQYNYNNPGFSSSTGHFTQLIWVSTTGVGCARCGGNGGQWYETYIACNYSPPGNYIGQFKQNVLPP